MLKEESQRFPGDFKGKLEALDRCITRYVGFGLSHRLSKTGSSLSNLLLTLHETFSAHSDSEQLPTHPLRHTRR
jgi:hypothetical protein